MNVKARYYAGVDGGGTKCRAEIYSENGKLLGFGISGPANVARHGKTALESVKDAVCLALQNAGLNPQAYLPFTHVGAGLAGAELSSSIALLNNWQHPFAEFKFTTDLHTACLGAHGGHDGAVLVVGTGSCCGLTAAGEFYQLGGHGFQLGDKGSGAWMGRQAVAYTLEALDGVQAIDTLSREVCAHFNCFTPLELVDRLNSAPSSDFGELAPIVLAEAAAKTPSAIEIAGQASEYLSSLARQAIFRGATKIALVGGVAQHIQHRLANDIREKITSSEAGPEWGAVHFLKFQREIANAS
ncbi:ATPase (plasmid) [Alteromonas sp. I4]|nr:ATPase [Alteromonas sp. I4]